MNYDFSTLSSLDFERLACDLMNAYFADKNFFGTFKSFKPGRDKGIDLLLSSPNKDFDIIAQVKHYNKSNFSKLKYDLKRTEREKIFALDPSTYLVITSLELSPQNKLEIKEIFEPYIVSLDHIFGREDLNAILKQNKDIEENHFKLWFSSSIILNKIINSRFIGRRREFSEKNLKKKLKTFVITDNYYKALSTLKENKFIVLTGEPGVGKSTLSEMIIYDCIKNNYELNIIYDDIKEIELTLTDDDSKQIFYFDDFLGHTQEEINKSKAAETSLIRIISRIEDDENKYLILNTRKFILNSFMDSSERIREFNPLRSENKIELKDYSYTTKRKILTNHVEASDLDINQKKVINNLAHSICTHDNFTPRIIEFFTNNERVNLVPNDLKNFILKNLNDPKEIWNHAYNKQITDYDRFLLNTLHSLGGEIPIGILNKAFNSRLDYEVRNNNFIKPQDSFNDSLKLMNDGFIVISDESPKYVSFINPSLEDFLKHRINKNILEIERILVSSIFIKQWYFFYKPYIDVKTKLGESLKHIFLKHYHNLLKNSNFINRDRFYTSIFINYFIDESSVENLEILKSINDWKFLNQDTHFYTLKFLFNSISNSKLNRSICNFDSTFFLTVIENEDELDNLIDLLRLFKRHYDIKFDLFFDREKYNSLLSHIYSVFNQNLDFHYEYLNKHNIDYDYHIEIINKIENFINFIKQHINQKFSVNYNFLLRNDWNDKADINKMEQPNRQNNNNDDIENSFYEYSEIDEYEDYSNISLDDIIDGTYKNKIKKYSTDNIISEEKDDVEDFFNSLDKEKDDLPF